MSSSQVDVTREVLRAVHDFLGGPIIADAAVGLPFMDSYIPLEHVGPNADLTLQFSTAPATRVLMAAATMLSVQRGTATIGIEVQAGDNQLAHGLATSLLLRSS